MIRNYNSLSGGRDTWLRNDIGEAGGSPLSVSSSVSAYLWQMLLLLMFALILPNGVFAQTNIAAYTYSASTGVTYSPITGGTAFIAGTYDQQISAAVPLGNTFTFGGVAHTTCYISANGFIAFGAAPTGSNYTPLSSLGSTTGAIAAFAQDGSNSTVAGAIPEIRYENVGSEFVVQFKDHANYSNRTTERLNFQIRLNFATGAVNIIYGACTNPGSSDAAAQVGLRGATVNYATNVNNLQIGNFPVNTTCDWSTAVAGDTNTRTMLFSSSNANVKIPAGLQYTWLPSTQLPVRTFAAVSGLTASSATVSWTAPTGATQYNLQYRVNGSCTWSNFSGNPVASTTTTLTGLVQNTSYQYRVQASNGSVLSVYSNIPNLGGSGNGYSVAGSFTTAVSCAAPSTVSATISSQTAASLSWSAVTDAGSGYQWEVRTSGAGGSGATGLVQSGITATGVLSASVSGLTANTAYTSYVRSNCGASFSSWTSSNFYTGYCLASGSSATYFINNFSTTGGSANITNNTSGYSSGGYLNATSQSVSNYAGTAINFATSFDGSSNTYGFSIFVDWNNDLDFVDAGEKVFGTTAYATSASGSITVPSGQALGNYRMRIVANYSSITPVSCNTAINGETEDYTFTVIAPPSCLPPLGLSAAPSFTSAALSWNASSSAPGNGYQWEVRTSGAGGTGSTGLAASGSTAAGVTTASAAGLTASTSYTLYVRSNCGAEFSTWSSSSPFFTGYCLSSGSSASYFINNFSTTLGATNITNNASGFAAGGYLDATAQTVSSYAGASVNFATAFNGTFSTYGFSIFVDWNNDLDFVDAGEKVFGTTTSVNSTTGSFTVPAGQVLGNYRMRIVANYLSATPVSCNTGISGETEDYTFTVIATPSCLPPTVLAASSVTTTGATISWTANTQTTASNGYDYEVRISGAGGSGSSGLMVAGSTAAGVLQATVSGLSANTTYNVYVRSHCSVSDFSIWTSGSTFYTGYCSPAGVTPTYYITNVTTTSGNTNISNVSTVSANGYGDFTSLSASQYAGGSINLSISTSSSTHLFYVWVDYNNDLDFNDSGEAVVATTSYASSYSGSFVIPVSAALGSYRMRIGNSFSGVSSACGPATTGREFEDYTLNVIPTPSCVAPNAIVASNVKATEATVSWTASTITVASNGYEFEVRTSGVAGSGSVGLVSSGTTAAGVLSKILTGLTSGLNYTVYVRAHCSENNFSTWSSVTFVTKIVIATPWIEGFTGTSIPSGWTAPNFEVGSFTQIQGNPGSAIIVNLYDEFDDYLTTATLTTPTIGPISADQVFQFDYSASNFNSPYGAASSGSGNFVVSISTDYGATYTTLFTVTNDGVAGYRTRSIPLSSYIGADVKFKIVTNYNSGDYIAAFDNFKISSLCTGTPAVAILSPSVQSLCVGTPVLTINATGYSGDSGVTFQWEQTLNSGTVWANAIGGSGANAIAYTPPNFAGNTIQYRMKSTCTNSGLVSYSTISEINSNSRPLPLNESFNDVATLGGWTQAGGVSIGSIRGATGNPGSNAYVRMYASNTTANFTSAKFGSVTAGQAFSFDLKLSNFALPYDAPAAGWGNIQVQVSTDCGGTYTTIGTIDSFTGSSYVNYKYNLGSFIGSDIRTKLLITRTAGNYDVSIDNWTIDVPAPQIESFSPTTVCSSNTTPIILTGYAFTGTTSVKFNNVAATSFTVLSDTSISAIAPAGVASGLITVTSPKGTGTSSTTFTVLANPVVAAITNGDAVLCTDMTVDMDNSSSGGVWSSSDPLIATVNNDGLVTAMSGGNATISYTVTDGGCSTTVTSSVVVNTPIVSSNPGAQTVVTGTNATFSVNATGGISAYQWNVSTDGGATYTALSNNSSYSGVNTAVLTIAATAEDLNGTYYQVIVSGISPCADFVSTGAILNVGDTGITNDPSNVSLCTTGSLTAIYNVGTSGEVDSYQWLEDRGFGPEPVSNGTFGEITYSGATTNQLTINGLSLESSGWSYQVIVTGPANTATSNIATLTVNQGVTVTDNPVAQTNCVSGGSATFAVQATGDISGYQWQYSTDGVTFTNVVNNAPAGTTYSGNTTNSLSVVTTTATPSAGTYFYRAVVTGGTSCAPISSSSAQLNLYSPAINNQPISASAYTGSTATFTVGTDANGATYQWQYATAINGTYTNVADTTPAGITYLGTNSATLSVILSTSAQASSARYYRAIVTAGGCSTTSTGAQLSIYAYCIPTTTNANMGLPNAVTNVVISNLTAGTNITQPSSAAAPWYTLYNENTLSVGQGQEMSAAITFGTNGNQFSAVWIDLNGNGSFEANENLGLATTSNGASSVKVYNFTIPYTATPGITRMRIRGGSRAAYTAAGACIASAYGETEDYVLNITAAPACSGNPIAAVVSSSVQSICISGSAVLTGTGFQIGVTGLTYQWYNSTTGAIANAVNSTYTTPILTSSASYFLRTTCAGSGTISDSNILTITVNNPTVISTTPGERCGPGSVALQGSASEGNSLTWYATATGGIPLYTGNIFNTPSIAATTSYYAAAETTGGIGNVTVGTGTTVTADIDAVTAFNNRFSQYRAQYLYTAAELSASGLRAGPISSVAFNITTIGDSASNSNFKVAVGTTTASTVTTTFATDLSTVFGPATYTHAVGVNTINFATPFIWDGISNILVEVSHSGANALYNAQTYFTATTGTNTVLYSIGANPTTGTTSTMRLNATFKGSVACSSTRTAVVATVSPSPAITLSASTATVCAGQSTSLPVTITSQVSTFDSYVWSPANTVSGSATTGYFFNPSSTTTYTLTGNQSGGTQCTSSVKLTVTVNPLPVALTVTPATTICQGDIVPLVVTQVADEAKNYTFKGSAGTYTAITGTTVASAIGDDVAVGNLPIGFTFKYNGSAQTVFAVTSNGFIELGSTLNYSNNTGSGWTPSANSLAGRANVLAPFWDDNNTTGGSVQYATTGTAGNRILTVQWTGMHVGDFGSPSAPSISVQALLYEATGVVEYRYGATSNTLISPSVSVGISGVVGNYRSVTPFSPASSSTVSSTSENTTVTESNIPIGTTYTFTPPTIGTVVWTPTNGLYTDAAATQPYNGSNSPKVYAKPNATTAYAASLTSSAGCQGTTVSTTVTVNIPVLYYVDSDNDGYGNPTLPTVSSCTQPLGYSANNTDCNDAVAAINPGHAEVLYNGFDDNCDGNLDEGFQIKTKLLPSSCGTTLASIGSIIGIQTLAPGSAYTGWRIKATNGAQVQIIERNVPHFTMTLFPSYDYAITYTIEIELQRNGVWLGYYGDACLVSTPAVLAESGATQISPSQCGITLPEINTLISTTSLAGVTGYRFRVSNITDPAGLNAVQIIDRPLQWFSLLMLTRYNYGTQYRIEVAVKTTGAYSGFGSPCTIYSPPAPTLITCGGTVPTMGTLVKATSLKAVTQYRFQITRVSDNASTTIDRTTNYFTFNMVPGGIFTAGSTYAIRVAVRTAESWSPFGDICEINAPGGAATRQIEETPTVVSDVFKATAYPNPFATTFGVDVITSSDKVVQLSVYDMLGKLIETREVQASELNTVKIGDRYSSGVYNVIVTQGETVKTLRVIKR